MKRTSNEWAYRSIRPQFDPDDSIRLSLEEARSLVEAGVLFAARDGAGLHAGRGGGHGKGHGKGHGHGTDFDNDWDDLFCLGLDAQNRRRTGTRRRPSQPTTRAT